MRWKYGRLALYLVTACWAAYTIFTFAAPAATNARFQLPAATLDLLRLTIIVPLYFIWTTAARGAIGFKQYAMLVRTGKEGPAFSEMANGLLWTLAYLVLLSLLGSVTQFFMTWLYYDVLVVIREHLPLLCALIGFFLLYRGSDRLHAVSKFTTWTKGTFLTLAGFAVFCILFVLAFTLNPPAESARTSVDFLPRSLLLVTQILPYLVAWFLGILAGINLAKYAANVKGVLYKKALRKVVIGIWGVVVFSVILQALTLSSRFFVSWHLASLVLLVYALMLFYSFGFVYINKGAKKLSKIEVPQ
jgi:hypothetical protein